MAAKKNNSNIESSSQVINEQILIIWLDTKFRDRSVDAQAQESIRSTVGKLELFSNSTACVSYLNNRCPPDIQIFIIISEALSEKNIPLIHSVSQIQSIYIYNPNQSKELTWTNQYKKIQGHVWNNIESICQHLTKQPAKCQNEFVPIPFVSPTEIKTGNRQDPSFVYNQLIKEILLDTDNIDSEEEARNQMLDFCEKYCANNEPKLRILNEFKREYSSEHAINWYTRECFLHIILNKALWTPEPDILYRFRYFLRHLHQQIVTKGSQQSSELKKATVFRGQGMPNKEFNKLKNGIGGLLSFSNFLSTSLQEKVALRYANPFKQVPDQTSILFSMNISSTVRQCPFVEVGDLGYYENGEQEILFTMGAVFRIDNVQQLEDNQWKVYLTLSDDFDTNLAQYMEQIRHKIRNRHPFRCLVSLVDEMGQYKVIEALETTFNECDFTKQNLATIGSTQHALGSAYLSAGNREKALEYLQNALSTYLSYYPQEHPTLSPTYNNIGSVYHANKDYETALTYHQLALDCQLQSTDPDLDSIATYSMNLAFVCHVLGRNDEASTHRRRALELQQQHRGDKDPALLDMYNAMGRMHYEKNEYDAAALYHEKALEIQHTASDTNPISSATFLLSMGQICVAQHQNNEAIQKFKDALDIQNQYLLPNHSLFVTTYKLLARAYYQQKKFNEAIPYYQRALEIEQNILKDDDPVMATSYFNLSTAYFGLSQYAKALEPAEKAVEQLRKCSNPDLSDLAMFIQHVGNICDKQRNYVDAIYYYEQSLSTRLGVVGENDGTLAPIYYNLAEANLKLKKYSKALTYFYKTLKIEQNTLADDDPSIGITYFKISNTYLEMSNNNEALTHAQQAVEQFRKGSNSNLLALAPLIFYVGVILHKQDKPSEAIPYYREALPLMEAYTDENDVSSLNIYHRIAAAFFEMHNFTEALPLYEKILKIQLRMTPNDTKAIASTYGGLSLSYAGLKRFDDAVDTCLKAIDQLSKTVDDDHEDVKNMRKYLEKVQKLQLVAKVFK